MFVCLRQVYVIIVSYLVHYNLQSALHCTVRMQYYTQNFSHHEIWQKLEQHCHVKNKESNFKKQQ